MPARYARAVLALSLLLLPLTTVRAQTGDYVRVRDGRFLIGDRPYYFVGVNYWYGMNLAATGPEGRARLVRELDALQKLGVTNLRILAASEGPASEPQRVHPAVQDRPGEYDETLLRGLDFELAELGKRNMRAVLVLNNFFQWTGGFPQYVSWATGEPIPYPERDGHSWNEFMDFSSRFYAVEKAMALFDRYVRMLPNRRNTVTGRLYRDDPTIMSWQLSNEPRGRLHSEAYVAWVDRVGRILRQEAPKQLISLGGEGKLPGAQDSTQFARVSRSRYLDYLTVHLWPQNWGWFDPRQADVTFDRSVGRSIAYIAEHVAIAEAVHKPMVLEEFGLARDGNGFGAETGVTHRDRYMAMIFESVEYLAGRGSVVAGANVWGWSGEGRGARPGDYWRPGEPFTGDPAHERQGWYSIYDSDTTTVALVGAYARRLDALAQAPAAAAGGSR